MYRCFFIIAACLVTAALSQQVGFFSFTQASRREISQNIYDFLKRLLNSRKCEEIGLEEVIKDVAVGVSRIHNVRDVDTDYVDNVVIDIIDDLMEKENYHYMREMPWDEIESYTLYALKMYCSDSYLPEFDYEPAEVGNILDFILVDWNESLFNMIQTRQGRLILRAYAKYAAIRLKVVFSCYNPEKFRALIRTLWMRRAQQYFNIRNRRYPYVPHMFDVNRIFPISDPDYFNNNLINRSPPEIDNWEIRNPMASQEDLDRILNIHASDRSSYYYECNIFEVYLRIGMSSVERYFERHNDQFYRTFFFFQELAARNVSTNEEDIYDGAIPFDIMPQEIQAIIYDDNAYRDYLLRLRRVYEDSRGNRPRRNLASSSRVLEEDLAELLITERPTSHISTTVVTTSTTASSVSTTIKNAAAVTMTVPVISSTDKTSEEKKKKGMSYVKYCQKHFSKQSQSAISDGCCYQENGYKKSIALAECSSKTFRRQQKQKVKSNYYGFSVASVGDSDELGFFEKEPSFYTKFFGDLSL